MKLTDFQTDCNCHQALSAESRVKELEDILDGLKVMSDGSAVLFKLKVDKWIKLQHGS